MSKLRLFFGLAIVLAIIMAGCTGTKTLVGPNNAGISNEQQSAYKAYQKTAGELSDEINYLKNHYKPADNATLDDYKAWLGGFKDKLGLCDTMYNNTTVAAKNYLGYLNNSSSEYHNVTAALDGFEGDINSLGDTYGQYDAYLNTTVKKMASLNNYKQALDDSTSAYGDLANFAKSTKVDSMDAYSRFIDGFSNRLYVFEDRSDTAIADGNDYLQYCDPNSSEYKGILDNNKALMDNVQKCKDALSHYRDDYNSKSGAKAAATGAAKDYVDKMGQVASTKKDLDSYDASKEGLLKLDQGYISGYRQKLDAFEAACNAAIASGDACLKYLDPSSKDYQGVTDNKKSMQDSMASYEDKYSKMSATYKNLHPLGSFLK